MFTGNGRAGSLRARIAMTLYRAAFRARPGRVIFQNADDMRLFTSNRIVRPDLAAVIRGSGVDLEQFPSQAEPTGTPVVMLAARLLWDKGVGEFVEAARRLRARGVLCRMVLVGTPDPSNPRQVPQEQVEAWAREGIVEWWGQRTDMPTVLALSTLVVLPSYREGLPRVLIEAAASGRAMIAADAPGSREVVQHGVTGLLVPVRDAGALADAIGDLLTDAPLRTRLAVAARRLAVDEFAATSVNRRTLAIYREMLGPRWPTGSGAGS
jgi:glycosyltransferase involved in cell wall biosynthesis